MDSFDPSLKFDGEASCFDDNVPLRGSDSSFFPDVGNPGFELLGPGKCFPESTDI